MKTLILLLILLVGTTTYAASFEESYKNAKKPIQKIQLLIGELKKKNAEIASLKEQISILEHQLLVRNTNEKELQDKIFMLNSSNEDKDIEIQKLGKIQLQVPESTRCTKDYWGLDGKPNRSGYSANMIISYNAEQRNECLAGRR